MNIMKSLFHDEVYRDHFENGEYLCVKCKAPLFDSADKFCSTTANPAFRKAVAGALETFRDS